MIRKTFFKEHGSLEKFAAEIQGGESSLQPTASGIAKKNRSISLADFKLRLSSPSFVAAVEVGGEMTHDVLLAQFELYLSLQGDPSSVSVAQLADMLSAGGPDADEAATTVEGANEPLEAPEPAALPRLSSLYRELGRIPMHLQICDILHFQ